MSKSHRSGTSAFSGCFLALFSAAALLALAGCEGGPREETPPAPPGTSPVVVDTPMPVRPPATAAHQPAGETVDLIGDRPGTSENTQPKKELLEDFTPVEPLDATARKAYRLLDDLKLNLTQISRDLDNGGKEITRLIRTSDLLAKNITELANLWPRNEDFRDVAGSAKSRALTLNDELSRVPRKWTNVRWAFNSTVEDLRRLRRAGHDLAEAEPKLIPIVDKNGKVVKYIEPATVPLDPALAQKERDRRILEEEREKLRRAEEARKNKGMPLDIDGNTAP